MKRGHDVTLLPFYTPTLTDEENVSRARNGYFFGGISVYLEHTSLFRHTPQCSIASGMPRVIKAFSSGSIAVDPALARARHRVDAAGRRRPPGKEIENAARLAGRRPRPDSGEHPLHAAHLARSPAQARPRGVPVVVTLQGEDLFLDGLPEPYRRQALDLIRAEVAHVDLFVAVSQYCADLMRGYLDIRSRSCGWRRSVLPRLNIQPGPHSPARRLPIGSTLHGWRQRRGCMFSRSPIASCAGSGVAPSRLRAAGFCGPDQQSYLDGIIRNLRACGLDGEFEYAGAPDRAGKFAFLRDLDVVRSPESLPRAKRPVPASKPWLPAFRSWRPITVHCLTSSRRPAAACLPRRPSQGPWRTLVGTMAGACACRGTGAPRA
jgi:hypothetical protein